MSEGHLLPGEGQITQYTERIQAKGAFTNRRAQKDGEVRTWNESDQAKGTHHLEGADRQVGTRKESDQLGHGLLVIMPGGRPALVGRGGQGSMS